MRKTYGYKKKIDWIAQKQIVEETGISKSHVSETIKKLKTKNMITREAKKIGIQKDYDNWKFLKQVTTVNKEKFLKQGLEVPDLSNQVPDLGNKKFPIQGDTKEKKETIQKKLIQKKGINDKSINEIFNYWNKKEIIVHKKLDQATSSSINAKLEDYSVDEIKDSIHIYSEILKGEEYWFKYKWTLKDFMQKGFEKFKDSEVAHENYLRKDKK